MKLVSPLIGLFVFLFAPIGQEDLWRIYLYGWAQLLLGVYK